MVRSFLSRSLIGKCDSSTAPLQGLRVISCFAIVMGHTFWLSPLFLDSPLHFPEKISATVFGYMVYMSFKISTSAAVDLLLFISGFLLASNLHWRYSKDTNRLHLYTTLQYLFSRWLRLVPLYGLMYILMNSNPNPRCTTIWELSLLKLPDPNFTCVLLGWSTLVDFQAHVFISLLFSCLPSLNVAESLAWTLTFLSAAFRIQKLLALDVPSFPPFYNVLDFIEKEDVVIEATKMLGISSSNFNPALPQHPWRHQAVTKYLPFYYFTEHRANALFIGVAVWLSMRYNTTFTRMVRTHSHSSCLFGVGCILFFCSGFVQTHSSLFFRTIHEGIGRILISITVGIFTILTCSVEKSGLSPSTWYLKWIRNVLGSKYFVSLARFSYVIYLTQFTSVFILGTNYPKITRENYGALRITIAGLKWYAFTLMLGVPFCMFEEVCLTLRKRLLSFLFPTKDEKEN